MSLITINVFVRETPGPRLRLPIGPVSEQQHLSSGPTEVTVLNILTDTQKVNLGPISGLDAKGSPATITGDAVAWNSSDDTVLAVVASADGLSATATAGKTGTAQLSAKVTLPDSSVLVGTADFEVHGGPAVSISIPVGTPVAQ